MASALFFLPFPTAFTSNGLPAAGAKASFYLTGTLTPRDTFTTSTLTTAHPNPVVADAAGRLPNIYLDTAVTYRLIIKDALGATLADIDPYVPGTTANAALLQPYQTNAANSATAAGVSETNAAASASSASTSATSASASATSANTSKVAAAASETSAAASAANAISGTPNAPSVIDARAYGATSANQTSALSGLQSAVNAASAQGKPLYLSQDTTTQIRVNGTVTIPAGGISIMGGGVVYSTADLPLFKLVGASYLETYSDFQVIFELAASPAQACAIELATPVGTDYIQYNTFDNIHTIGAIATIVSSSATRTTSFGEESATNWNIFKNLKNLARIANDARNVIWFKTGSGTGNTFSELTGNLNATGSAYVRMDGVGAVVGDVIISNSHFCAAAGGVVDCAVFEYGPNTVYRSNIQVIGSQADAQLTRVFRLSSVGSVVPKNLNHDGSLIGGGAVLGITVPINTMRISDRDGGLWQGGGAWSTDLTGLQTIAVCKATLGTFTGVRVKLTIAGLVGGVSAGVCTVDIALRSDGVTTTATTISTSSDPAGLFAVTYTVVGLAATINITFSPTAAGSSGFVTWEAVGNEFFLERVI